MKTDNFWYKVVIVVSLLLFTQVIGPFMKEGLWLGHDSQLHTMYLKQFDKAIHDGQFPVRWIDWFKIGHNQPLFNFYQPGAYYLYMIPRLLGLGYVQSLNTQVAILWLVSGSLMFLFARRHFGVLGGILAAYFYTLAPYHIVDILVRVAIPEFTAMAFVPGIFWGIKAYFDTKKSFYLSVTALFTALTAFSHPPTIIMFSLLLLSYLGYLSFLSNLKMSRETLLSSLFSLLSLLLGFGIVSFSLLPAFFEQRFIQPIFLRSGYYDFHSHFTCFSQLFSTFWGYGTSALDCVDGMSFQLGLAHWLGVGIVLLILLSVITGKKIFSNLIDQNLLNKNYLVLIVIFLAILGISLFLMFSVSLPIWLTLPYIKYIQYPWRFLSVAIFSASVLSASLIPLIKQENLRLMAFVGLMGFATLAYGNYLKPVTYGTISEEQFGLEILHPSLNLKTFDPEPGYMPKWVQILPAEDDRPKEEAKILTGNGTLKDTKLTAANKSYQFSSLTPLEIRFYVHYYPGWKVYLNDKAVELNYDNIYGFMDVKIPEGENKVTLKFENTPLRTTANIMSLVFIAILLIVSFSGKFNSSRLRT